MFDRERLERDFNRDRSVQENQRALQGQRSGERADRFISAFYRKAGWTNEPETAGPQIERLYQQALAEVEAADLQRRQGQLMADVYETMLREIDARDRERERDNQVERDDPEPGVYGPQMGGRRRDRGRSM